MNVKSSKKRFASPRHSEQGEMSFLRAVTSPPNNMIPKSHVGAEQNNQLQFNQANDRMFSPISEKNYLNISIDQDDFVPSRWQSDTNEDLFDTLYSDPNLLLENDPTTESANNVPENTPIPQVDIQENTTNSTNQLKDIYGTLYRPEISMEQINRHPIKPLVDAWSKQANGGDSAKQTRTTLLNRFLRFLVAYSIEYPVSIHISQYIEELSNDPLVNSGKDCYISAVGRFFKWTAQESQYPNIAGNLINDLDLNKPEVKNENANTNKATVETSKLTRALNAWINTLERDPTIRTNSRCEITNLILYLTQKHVINSRVQNIVDYYQTNRVNDTEIIENFFSWIEEQGIGGNITLNIEDNLSPMQRLIIKKRKNQIEQQKGQALEQTLEQNQVINVDDMKRAGFSYNESAHLINNELRVFKDWLDTITNPSNIGIFKRGILEFAYFLLKEKRITTPTQNTIISFYKIHLRNQDPAIIRNYLTAIKSFFEWTAAKGIYTNIAINCRISLREDDNNRDIPILYNSNRRRVIPKPSNPLIKISHI